ncbi:hypothetical protein ACHAWF_005512 [Thalassiosira exigua]
MHCRPSQQSLMMFRKRPAAAAPPSAASSSSPPKRDVRNGTTGPGAGGGDGEPTRSTQVLIQRFIILHDGLKPSNPSKSGHRAQQRKTPQLGEDASLEEHGEFILYYFDHSLHFSHEDGRRRSASSNVEEFKRLDSAGTDASGNSTNKEKPPADHATEEAVRFAGICRALRSLPLALQSENSHGEESAEAYVPETDVVHLKDSTLVFVQLELGGDIIAVAQVPRAEKSQEGKGKPHDSPVGFGADSSAMALAMKQIHVSFSIFFGGGIHRRLLRTKHLENSKDWVLEVIEDDEVDEGNVCGSLPSRNPNKGLKVKGDSVWEVTDDEQVELVEHVRPLKKGSRCKSRTLKRLSSSITMASSPASSFTNPIVNQMKKTEAKESHFEDYRYGGMEELFNLRHQRRKLSNELKDRHGSRFGGLQKNSRWGSNSNAEDLFNDIANDFGHNDCERRMENLLGLLPITKLREDLVEFYDNWLHRLQGVSEIMHGGVGRCVVDMVPPPVRGKTHSSVSEPVRGQHPPLAPNAPVCLAAAEFMKALRQGVTKPNQKWGRLFGMSLFYHDRLVLSKVFPSDEDGQMQCALPPDIPCLIAEHFQTPPKKGQVSSTTHNKDDGQAATNVSSDAPLARWISNLSLGGSQNDIMAEEIDLETKGSDGNTANDTSGFLAHPSSSCDANELSESLFISGIDKNVWMPCVHLPPTFGSTTGDNDDEKETHVAMYQNREFRILVYFDIPSNAGSEGVLAQMGQELQPKSGKRRNGMKKSVSHQTQSFADMLTCLSHELSEFCNTYSSHGADFTSGDAASNEDADSGRLFPGEPGLDILYIDRDEGSFVLLSQHDLSSNELKRAVRKSDGDSSPKPKFGLFGIGSKPKETSQDIERRPSQYMNMMDCRHKLAACLPLDVMLAFDDMFNEIQRLLRDQEDNVGPNALSMTSQDTHSTERKKSIELCTFLPQGWVYGRAFCNIELYVLLDTSKFVTINDVQKAVARVRERIFNDKIR